MIALAPAIHRCPNCHDYFTITDYHKSRQKYCSKRCADAYRARGYRMAALGPPAKCVDCGTQLVRRSAKRCQPCYRKYFRSQPEARAKHIARVNAYQKANPEKRKRWQRNYYIRSGRLVPDLTKLREANKNLEQALAHAAQRERVGSAAEFDRDGRDEWDG